MPRAHHYLVALTLLLLPITARAERPPQEKSEAPVAIIGTVEAVDERWDLDTDYYKITVRVEQVERGPARPGELFVVSCFQWSRGSPWMAGASGHDSIPDIA